MFVHRHHPDEKCFSARGTVEEKHSMRKVNDFKDPVLGSLQAGEKTKQIFELAPTKLPDIDLSCCVNIVEVFDNVYALEHLNASIWVANVRHLEATCLGEEHVTVGTAAGCTDHFVWQR